MSPAKGNIPKSLNGDAIVELTGNPVSVRRTPPAPQEGDDVKASRIVYHTGDGSVKLWDYRSAKLLDSFLGLAGPPAALAFSPNGRLLLVDGQEKTTRIYDVSAVKAP